MRPGARGPAARALLPWTPGRPAPGDDPHDYLTGPAVFWRYALHAFRRGPPALRAALAAPAFRAFAAANGAAAAAAPLPPPGGGGGAACGRLVGLANDLAALNAAAALRPAARPAPAAVA